MPPPDTQPGLSRQGAFAPPSIHIVNLRNACASYFGLSRGIGCGVWRLPDRGRSSRCVISTCGVSDYRRAGVGAFIVGNNGKAIKATLRALPRLMRRSKYNKDLYMDLMALLFRLLAKSRQQGMLSLEFDIDNPQESEIFSNYPRILADNTLVEFITDYLRLMVSGNMNAFEIEALMDEEIETYEQESGARRQPGDGGRLLPAFGIVAAVMGWCTPWLRPIGRLRNWAR